MRDHGPLSTNCSSSPTCFANCGISLLTALGICAAGLIAFLAPDAGGQAAPDAAAFDRKFRAGWDAMMRDPRQTPLKPAELAGFHGISWFPIQSAYRVTARFARTPSKQTFAMRTSSGGTDLYIRAGILSFTLNGHPCRLNAYKSAKLADTSLFIPFTDTTSGHESYGGGRYLEVPVGKGGDRTVTLDFNIAYNPYCAYTGGFSCPIPPRENHLQIAVKAGAKAYHQAGGRRQ